MNAIPPPDQDPLAPERHGPMTFDGIREMDTNPPRLWTVFYITTVLAALALLVAYPSIPFLSAAVPSVFPATSRANLITASAKADASAPDLQSRFERASIQQAEADPALRAYATAAGHAVYGENCAACHGRNGRGSAGYPNLADKDWLWGGSVEAIEHTLKVGVRWPGSTDTRVSEMPAFGAQRILERGQVSDLVDYVRSLSGAAHDATAASRAGETYATNCAACHGAAGRGNAELGAPNLTDTAWLYGGSREAIYDSIWNSRAGTMPAIGQRMPEDTIRKLVIYVRGFGGGE